MQLARPNKLDSLTSLRFFAAAGVVVHHLMDWQIPHINFDFGVGVSFFFVLSGFILTYVYQAPQQKLGKYYLARVARIFPLHIATLLFAALFLVPGYTARGPLEFVQNLFLLQSWTPTFASVFSYNHVAWTLSVELLFYLIFPAVIFMQRAYMAVLLLTVALIISALAFIDTTSAANVSSETGFSTIALVQSYPILRLPEFLLGIGCALLFAKRHSVGMTKPVVTVFEIGCLLIFAGAVLLHPSAAAWLQSEGVGHSTLTWLKIVGYAPAFGLIIFVFAHEAGAVSQALRWRPLVILGEASFALYMTHQLVFRVFQMNGWGLDGPSSFWCSLLIALSLATALLTWRFIEIPGRKLVILAPRFLRPRPVAVRSVD